MQTELRMRHFEFTFLVHRGSTNSRAHAIVAILSGTRASSSLSGASLIAVYMTPDQFVTVSLFLIEQRRRMIGIEPPPGFKAYR